MKSKLTTTYALMLSLLIFHPAIAKNKKLSIAVNSFVGYSKKNLFSTWGMPNNISHDGQSHIYEYGFHGSSASSYPSGPSGLGNAFTGLAGALAAASYCKIQFFAYNSSKIYDALAVGNSCGGYAKKKLINAQFLIDLQNKKSQILGFDYKIKNKGIKVKSVIPESKASKQGLTKGDYITSINGKNIVDIPKQITEDLLSNRNNYHFTIKRKKFAKELNVNIARTTVPTLSLYSGSEKRFMGFKRK